MSDINEHWRIINSGGRQVANTPEQLWDQACSYFMWCDEHPITAKRLITAGKRAGERDTIEYKRPYTIEGFCLHANLSRKYVSDIRGTHDQGSEYFIIMERILMVIYTQNLEGATVDLYNPIIVSKVLGLDNKDNRDDDRPVKVEVVNSSDGKLPNSEDEVLKKLDFGKVEILKEKVQNASEENHQKEK